MGTNKQYLGAFLKIRFLNLSNICDFCLIKLIIMGKGDRKTKRGKIVKGSYGVSRPHKKKNKEAGEHNQEDKPKKGKK